MAGWTVTAQKKPEDNASQLQALLNRGDDPLRVEFGDGLHWFPAGAVKVPTHRQVTFCGRGNARLAAVGYGRVFGFKNVPGKDWTGGSFAITDFPALSGTVIGCSGLSDDGKAIQLAKFRMANCGVFVFGRYGVDMSTGYCFAPVFDNVVFGGGGLRWVYDRKSAEPHATSCMIVRDVCVTNGQDNRPGPDLMLEGCQNVLVQSVTLQGWGAFMPGVDPIPYRNTVGAFVSAYGLRGGKLENVWLEIYGQPDGWSNLQVWSPYKNGGAYASGEFVMDNCRPTAGGSNKFAALPDKDNVDDARLTVLSGPVPVLEGKVRLTRNPGMNSVHLGAAPTQGEVDDGRERLERRLVAMKRLAELNLEDF
jgi:hypothetical protein